MADPDRDGGHPSPLPYVEKRESDRIPVPSELLGEVMVFQPMTVTEISVGGAKVDTAFALQLDSVHDFRLTLHDRSIVLKGRVVHSRIHQIEEGVVRYRSGIQFIDAPQRAAGVVADFVQRLQNAGPVTSP